MIAPNSTATLVIESVTNLYGGRVVVVYRPANDTTATTNYYAPLEPPGRLDREIERFRAQAAKKRPFFPPSSLAPLPEHVPVQAPPVRPRPRLMHFASPPVWARRSVPGPSERASGRQALAAPRRQLRRDSGR